MARDGDHATMQAAEIMDFDNGDSTNSADHEGQIALPDDGIALLAQVEMLVRDYEVGREEMTME
jgi:hypothetical protein